jgi:hypothetical protein
MVTHRLRGRDEVEGIPKLFGCVSQLSSHAPEASTLRSSGTRDSKLAEAGAGAGAGARETDTVRRRWRCPGGEYSTITLDESGTLVKQDSK